MAVVLHPKVATWRYAQSGKKEIYLDALQQLAEEPAGSGGGLRYGPKTLHDLDVRLTYRGLGHSKVLFQLCHFVRAAACLAGDPNAWLWPALGVEGRVGGTSLRRHLEACGRAARIAFEADDLVIDYAPGDVVRLAYGVLPRLVVTLDFMLTTGILNRDGEAKAILDAIASGPYDATAVARHKGRLQAHLDGWLDKVQRSRQELEKFHQLVKFLGEDGQREEIVFDDASLLVFWQAAAADPETYPGNIKFRTVFELFTTALLAFQDAEHLLEQRRAAPLGLDFEAGEVDVADTHVHEHGEQVSWLSPLERFATGDLAATEVLVPAECQRLATLLDAGPAAILLQHSLLRAEVMGAVQAKLSESKRRASENKHLTSLAVLDRRSNTKDEFPKDYAAVIAVYADLLEHVMKMRRALAHVRYRYGGAVLTPAEEEKHGRELRRAGRIFSRIARDGFRRLKDNEAEAELFLEAADLLEPIAHRLETALVALKALAAKTSLDELLEADRAVFAATFARIYGETR